MAADRMPVVMAWRVNQGGGDNPYFSILVGATPAAQLAAGAPSSDALLATRHFASLGNCDLPATIWPG
jgi:hypothetical protein